MALPEKTRFRRVFQRDASDDLLTTVALAKSIGTTADRKIFTPVITGWRAGWGSNGSWVGSDAFTHANRFTAQLGTRRALAVATETIIGNIASIRLTRHWAWETDVAFGQFDVYQDTGWESTELLVPRIYMRLERSGIISGVTVRMWGYVEFYWQELSIADYVDLSRLWGDDASDYDESEPLGKQFTVEDSITY